MAVNTGDYNMMSGMGYTGNPTPDSNLMQYAHYNDLKWVARPDGGVDYFGDGQPINRETFAWNTGQDVGAIENWAKANPGVAEGTGNSTPAANNNQNGGGTSNGIDMGILRQALDTHKKNIQAINDAYQAGILSFAEKDKAIKQNMETIKTDLQNQQASTSAYFQNVSPDAYQSQQGNYYGKVQQEYDTKNNNLVDSKNSNDQSYNQLVPTYQNKIANEISNYNQSWGKYGTPDVQDANSALQGSLPDLNSVEAANLTPVTMAQVGAQLSPNSPNGDNGQGMGSSYTPYSPNGTSTSNVGGAQTQNLTDYLDPNNPSPYSPNAKR